ncbi:MAG: T9SS type A sorting domain-containing protein [Flavobacteriales bacterium]|nr:T9SS type A sorting domain-containing protein [Flavobacteriales bacterium]
MRQTILLALIFMFSAVQSYAQYLVSIELLDTYTAEELDLVPGQQAEYDVEFYKVVYNTVDANGNATIASGAFSKPVSDECTLFPISIYNHGTVLNKENVPSRDNAEAFIGKFIASLGYYSLAPDYIGMGDSPGLHPYVHAQSEATAGVDLIRAMREHLVTIDEADNGELLITGYSQGGHAAMALHKYIEDNALLDEFNVLGSAPGSGPYNLSGSQTATILSGEPYSNPGYIVYALSSYELAYGNIYGTYSDVLQDPYDGIVVPYFDGNNTTYSMANLNPQLPQVITDLLTPAYYSDFESNMDHPFRLALADNDNYDWTPQRGVRMYYCTQDEQVDYTNSTDALAAMQTNGAPDVAAIELGPLDHGDCFLPAMLGAINYFNSIRTECVSTTGIDAYEMEFSVYPNPAVDLLTIQSTAAIAGWSIVDARGQVVLTHSDKKYGNRDFSTIKLRALKSGIYTLRLVDNEGNQGEKVFIKN